MDGLKAALVLFIASLLQLSVLTEYRSFWESALDSLAGYAAIEL